MWGSASFLDRLRAEVWYRYLRLRDEYGADRVARPGIALLGALAEVAAPTSEQADAPTVHAAAYHAAEIYEYLVRRWQDPRWREVVTVAIAVGVAGLDGRSERGEAAESRCEFAALEAGAGTGVGISPRPSPA